MATMKKVERDAKKRITKAKQGLTMTVGQAKAAALKALRAAHEQEKALTGPIVDKFQSEWKRQVKRVKQAAR
jgi:hypothetical protein